MIIRIHCALPTISGLLILAATLLPSPSHARTWTSTDGRTIEAELVAYNAGAGTVRIRRSDGNEFTLDQTKLSADDLAHLRELEAEKEKLRAVEKEKAGATTSHASTGQHKVPFHVYYPKSYDGSRKLPMLILYSPGGGGKAILNKFTAAADEVEWVLVGCDQLKNGLPETTGDAMFTEMLPDIEKTVTHDPDRLYLGGMSGGAMRAYGNSSKFDRPWKGIVACGGWLGGGERLKLDYPDDMAVAMINGDNDKGANAWVEKDSAVLKENHRCNVRVFNFPGGHTIAPPEVLTEAMQWIKSETETAPKLEE